MNILPLSPVVVSYVTLQVALNSCPGLFALYKFFFGSHIVLTSIIQVNQKTTVLCRTYAGHVGSGFPCKVA